MKEKSKKNAKKDDSKKDDKKYSLLLKNIFLLSLLFIISLIFNYLSEGDSYQKVFVFLSFLFGLALIGVLLFLLIFNIIKILKK